MDNVIYFDRILEEANLRRKKMADVLDELERTGYLSEEYIAYSLRFMTLRQLKHIVSSVKFILRSDLKT